MAEVESNLGVAQKLLYTKYNKTNFDNYTYSVESMIILHNFLMPANSTLNIALNKCTASGSTFENYIKV